MTILVLELEKPSDASWEAIWALRQSFLSYTISFFWLGAMWVNLHSQWQAVTRIDNRVVWANVIMLFFSSLFPWVTDFLGKNFMSPVANGAYLAVVMTVSLSNMLLNRCLGEANRDDRDFYMKSRKVEKVMWADVAVKLTGFVLAMFIYPPLTLLFVMLAGILPSAAAARIEKLRRKS